ncbi:MAG: hypothetical protein LBJ09_02930 [Clostridiales bacterium]|jgi:hypothetical protein|nr:hypothetical protein [Clostridiales bacterium]
MDLGTIFKNAKQEDLQKAFEKISECFNPIQKKQIEYAIKNANNPTVQNELRKLNMEDIKKKLKENPNIAQKLKNSKNSIIKDILPE